SLLPRSPISTLFPYRRSSDLYTARPNHDNYTGAKRVRYYVDPMHPSYRSDKPGIAPDCGMALEPVYEGEDPAAKLQLKSGAVSIDRKSTRLNSSHVSISYAVF